MKKFIKTSLFVALTLVLAFPAQIMAASNWPSEWEVAEGAVSEQHFFGENFLNSDELIASEFGMEFASNYIRSVTALNELMSTFPQDRLGNVSYPSYFGGVYIDYYGNLIVLVAGSNQLHMDVLMRIDGVESLRVVEFSYSELRNTMDMLRDAIPFDSTGNNIANGWYLDVKGNRVVVELANYNLRNINLFRRTILDSPMLVFAQCPGLPVALGFHGDLSGMPTILPWEDWLVEWWWSPDGHGYGTPAPPSLGYDNRREFTPPQGQHTNTLPAPQTQAPQSQTASEPSTLSRQAGDNWVAPGIIDVDGFVFASPVESVEANQMRFNLVAAPGFPIDVHRNWVGSLGGLSVGYPARCPWGTLGFVTAAHAGIQATGGGVRNGDIVTVPGTNQIVGYVAAAALQDFDAAFIRLQPNVAFNRNGINNWFTRPVVGRMSEAVGRTTGHRWGQITAVNRVSSLQARLPNGQIFIVRLSNATYTNFRSWPGDSGGLAYTMTGPIHLPVCIIGIVVGAGANFSVISDARNINWALGIWLD